MKVKKSPPRSAGTRAELYEELVHLRGVLEQEREASGNALRAREDDVQRISKMYSKLDSRLAAIRNALGIIASFDANRWSRQFHGYELVD